MNYLKELRIKKGMTRPELADKLNVTANFIWYLETDRRKPSIDTLRKYSDEFQITMDEIAKRIGV